MMLLKDNNYEPQKQEQKIHIHFLTAGTIYPTTENIIYPILMDFQILLQTAGPVFSILHVQLN